MDKKVVGFLGMPLYPYLYGISFIAYKSARYFPSFSFLTAFLFLLCYCLLCYAISSLLKKFSSSAFNGISILIIFASLFHVATVAQFIGYDYADIPGKFYGFFYLAILAFVFLVLFLFRRLKKERCAPSFNRIINAFLIITTAVFLINGMMYAGRTYERPGKPEVKANIIPAARQKDIIWFLFDEYPSITSVKHQFGFDNPIGKQLSDKGFVVLNHMKSRFANTLFSLNSIFNYDDSIAPANYYAGVRSLRRNAWISDFDSSGYQVINLGFFDLGNHAMLADRSGYPQTYFDQLISGTIINALINKTKFGVLQCDRFTQEILQKLHDTLRVSSAGHRFIWVHLSIPHEPFCRDNKGNLLKERNYGMSSDTNRAKKQFVEYLQYGNNVLKGILESDTSLYKNIIIISGDHGPRFAFLKNKEYEKWPIAAIRMPGSYDTLQLHQLRFVSEIPSFLMHHLTFPQNGF